MFDKAPCCTSESVWTPEAKESRTDPQAKSFWDWVDAGNKWDQRPCREDYELTMHDDTRENMCVHAWFDGVICEGTFSLW